MRPQNTTATFLNPIQRIRIWYALLLVMGAVFIVRLFYLQVIRHDHYQQAALSGQLKEYEIPAQRGVIEVHNGDTTIPIVLNEMRYTLFADPVYVEDPAKSAKDIVGIIGGSADEYEALLKTADTRYVVLAKHLAKEQSEKLVGLEAKGIGTREMPYRTYPQGALAAQLLGFVNEDGEGVYGVEQALNKELSGVPGQLKAITDAAGVPLAANRDNVNIEPRAGKRLVLTVDIGMQQQLEDILKDGLKRAQSESGSALILEAKTGAVKAMANFPTYNPAEFYKVEDGKVFNNAAVSEPLEVASIMKPLVVAAALDMGVVNENSTFHDTRRYQIDDAVIRNVEEDGGVGEKSITDILRLSLNTGTTWLLAQMGGGEINKQARERWHDYMVNHYRLGKATGIEQGYEAAGVIPDPNDGFGLNIRYANTTFGQGMSATPLQMAAALASVVNGGTYYQPYLISKVIEGDQEVTREPKVIRSDVVSPRTGRIVKGIMEYSFGQNRRIYGAEREFSAHSIGGKTGTAEVARPEGGYYKDIFNGTFAGFVGGDEPQYVIVVRVDRPKIAGYAGAKAAGPIFASLADMLITNFEVKPRS